MSSCLQLTFAFNEYCPLISGHRRPTDLLIIDSGVGEETPLSAY
jgi:hypothetical protein